MAAQVAFKEHEKLLWKIAHKVHRRLWAAGAKSTMIEDVFGELSVAWCIARDAWQPEHNVPFGAYLQRGCYLHINRWVDEELKQHNIAPFDLDAETDDSHSPHERVSDMDAKLPDDLVIEADLRNFMNDPMRWSNPHLQVSERTRQFLRLIDDPPEELVQMFQGLRARADFARKRGVIPGPAPRAITAAMVFDFLGCDRTERTRVYNEVKLLAAEINQ